MNYISNIQKAIEYIEENLEEEINYEKVAKQIGMSSYYFHRIFSAVIGMSPAEYIRNRRLTCAAEDLSRNDYNILEVAVKYKFESNEAFTRAFTKFHGILPKLAKQKGNVLKAFSKIKLDIQIDGGKILNYRIEEKEEFEISAIIRNFTIENKAEIPMFWDEVKENGKLKEISQNSTKNVLGICIVEENKKEYKYGIGREIYDNDSDINDAQIINVPKSKWIVFKCQGQEPEDINELWSRIYIEYFAASEYKQSMNIDFELYDDKDTEIWIPIEEKKV